MDASAKLAEYLNAHPDAVGKVVDFDAGTDQLYHFDFTKTNTQLKPHIFADTARFTAWVNSKLKESGSRYGIGGYMEHRTIYARSPLFDSKNEPRRLHLGVDIWAESGTPVYSPMDAIIHSFADNANYGDYGPTLILQHNLGGLKLYSLYGHLSRGSLVGLSIGQPIAKNQKIATLGASDENGHWPPHLHFQLVFDIGECMGDYPGVGRYSEKEALQQNIPDPNLILRFT